MDSPPHDDREPVYDETDRTDEYIELQNRDSKLIVRLHAERAYWRRPSEEDWKTWVSGEWVPLPTADDPLDHDNAFSAPDDRVAWHYTEGDVTATIYESGEGEWSAQRSDDKEVVYDEIARTDEHIELQNQTSKLFVRLTSGRGYWRLPREEDWSRWVRGEWGPRPDSVLPLEPVTEHHVRLVYFVPSDRTPVDDYAVKIRLIMSTVDPPMCGLTRRQAIAVTPMMTGSLLVRHASAGVRGRFCHTLAPRSNGGSRLLDQTIRWSLCGSVEISAAERSSPGGGARWPPG